MNQSSKSVSLLINYFVVVIGLVFSCNYALGDLVGSVETKGLSFISQDYENTKSSNFGFFGASLKSYRSENDAFKMNLSGMYAVGHPVLSYLNVSEIYFSYDVESNSQIHIGRKSNVWSNIDERWNLGFFQPQFRWNSLAPESQGLTGFFWEKTTQDYSFMFFGSPVFIPDQGPGYELKNGQFESNNPWFQAPPQNILFQNQLLPIDYQIQNPNLSDVVFQTSFGLQLKYGQKTGFFADGSLMYKPSHQVALGYKGVLVTDHVKIDILPKTYYENLVAADVGYKNDWGSIDLSVLYLRPNSPDFDAIYNRPVLSESTTFGPHFGYNITDSVTMDLNGLMTQGDEITEVGPDTDVNRQPLTSKFLYSKAYEVSLNYKQIFNKKFKITSQLSWRAVEKNKLRLLKSKNIFDIKGPWKFMFDFILVETSEEATNISSYRNLDQMWIGASYDF